MGVHIREIYAGRWRLRIRYRNIRVTKAVGPKERAIELKKKLTTALELYGLDEFRVLEEEKEPTVEFSPNRINNLQPHMPFCLEISGNFP